jgi:hypothetical protein
VKLGPDVLDDADEEDGKRYEVAGGGGGDDGGGACSGSEPNVNPAMGRSVGEGVGTGIGTGLLWLGARVGSPRCVPSPVPGVCSPSSSVSRADIPSCSDLLNGGPTSMDRFLVGSKRESLGVSSVSGIEVDIEG